MSDLRHDALFLAQPVWANGLRGVRVGSGGAMAAEPGHSVAECHDPECDECLTWYRDQEAEWEEEREYEYTY